MKDPQPGSESGHGLRSALHPGLMNAFVFAGFNALSFQIILGSPMVLYAKSLHASATVLGIIAGMTPLLVIFQIPAANYIERIGYKKLVHSGWSIRVIFIFVMALVPLTAPKLSEPTRIALLLALQFAFNLSRGISSSAWLPWITSLVPDAIRGRYVSLDAAFMQCGSLCTLVFAALILGHHPAPWQFAVIFGFSGMMGAVSLGFLKRIPDASVPEGVRTSSQRVPYRAMVAYPPFRKFLWVILIWAVTYGGVPAFTVAYLKVAAGLSERSVLLVTSTMFIGGLGSLWLGTRLDKFGSKPILLFCFVLWIANLAGWSLLAGKVLPPALGTVFLLQFTLGLLTAMVNISYTRLAMVLIPEMGRNHFFAIYSVAMYVTLGLAPILWGLVIDYNATLQVAWHGFEWNRYSLFFSMVALGFLATAVLARNLHEPQAGRMEDLLRDILIQSPQRFWLRLWPRG